MDTLINWKCSCADYLGKTCCVLLLQHILPPNLHASPVFGKFNGLCPVTVSFLRWFIFMTDWISMIILSSNNLDSHLLTSTNKCSHTSYNFLTKGPSLNSFTNTLGTNHFGIGRLLKAPILAFLMKVLEQAILGLPARFRRVLGRVLDAENQSDALWHGAFSVYRRNEKHSGAQCSPHRIVVGRDPLPCPLKRPFLCYSLLPSVGERTAGLRSWGVEVLLHGGLGRTCSCSRGLDRDQHIALCQQPSFAEAAPTTEDMLPAEAPVF